MVTHGIMVAYDVQFQLGFPDSTGVPDNDVSASDDDNSPYRLQSVLSSANSTGITVFNLIPDGVYFVRIVAINGAGGVPTAFVETRMFQAVPASIEEPIVMQYFNDTLVEMNVLGPGEPNGMSGVIACYRIAQMLRIV